MKKITLYLVLIIVLSVSCKKQRLPEDIDDTPKFYFTGNVEEQFIDIEAGNDKYYMFSSHHIDSARNLNIYMGELKEKLCMGTCNNALAILINDVEPGTGGRMNVDSALWVGFHAYNDKSTEPAFYITTFTPNSPVKPFSKYIWTVSDGTTANVYNSPTITLQLAAQKKYTVQLRYEDASGTCISVHTNEFRIGNPLQTGIRVTREEPMNIFKYNFAAQNTVLSSSNVGYVWDFGDGSPISTEPSPSHVFNTHVGPYIVKMRIVDPNMKDTCISYHQVFATPDKYCEANFNAVFEPVPSNKIYGSVTVMYTDQNGDVYSTLGFLQPYDSQFELIETSTYKLNERGENTRKFSTKFNCTVKYGNKTKKISNARACFAVSYK